MLAFSMLLGANCSESKSPAEGEPDALESEVAVDVEERGEVDVRGDSTPAPECTATLPEEGPVTDKYETILEEFELVMPSGNTVYGLVRRPDPEKYPGLCFPGLVKVPGGINPGRTEAYTDEVEMIAGAGMVVVCFNAEGRVDDKAGEKDKESEGDEDYNGFRNQDGLRKVVQWTMDLPYVAAGNVGIRTQSYGITMGAGCVGRYPDLGVKYLVDGEGPPFSFVTCHGPRFLAGDMDKYDTVKGIFPFPAVWQEPDDPDVAAFWKEREAVKYIGGFKGRYLRLQATWDHAQPPETEADIASFDHPGGWPGGGPAWYQNKHTNDIVNVAVDGGVPWVRVYLPQQGNGVNEKYAHDNQPQWLPGTLKEEPWAVKAVVEMARME